MITLNKEGIQKLRWPKTSLLAQNLLLRRKKKNAFKILLPIGNAPCHTRDLM